MKRSILLVFFLTAAMCFTNCNREAGCPGVRAYTQGGGVKSSGKKKGNAIRNKKLHAKKSPGNAPWLKKTKKKDDKKATSGLFSKKEKRKSKQVE